MLKERVEMKYKAITGTTLTLLLIGILTLAFNIQPAKSEPRTWIVDDDGPADFHAIQEAINAASPGDTIYVYNGTYYENLVVSKAVSLIGENKYNTIIDGRHLCDAAVTLNASNVNISGFTIRKGGLLSVPLPIPNGGILIRGSSSGNNITNNIVTNNTCGIFLFNSSNNILADNTVLYSNWFGIVLFSSNNNIISGNKITANKEFGIMLTESSNNSFSGNDITNNTNGICLGTSSSYNIMYGNNITANDEDGIYLAYSSSYNIIHGNNITANVWGIEFLNSSNNMIWQNSITANDWYGIYLYLSLGNIIHGNNITDNGCGIESDSSSNFICHNNFVNPANQVFTHNSVNIWDNGYPSGGNYWSDHVCTGNPSNGSQPYVIDENNIDHYPFQDPNGWSLNMTPPSPPSNPPPQNQSVTVFVDPPTIEGKVIGETVMVNIRVSNVTDLYGWQAGMTFNPEVLECTGFYEGEFLKRAGVKTLFAKPSYLPDFDNTKGIAYLHFCTLLGAPRGVSGSGQLAYITFNVIGTGISDLHLTDVKLCNSLPKLIPIEVIDVFTVSWGGVDYSVKIESNLTGVDNPPYLPYSGSFYHTFIPEEKTVTFNVTTTYDNFYDVTIPKDILSCDNLSDWTVKVDGSNVTFVPTESPTDTSLYFTYHNGTHKVEIIGTMLGKPGDINDDNVVDIMDILIVGIAFGSKPGDHNWNPIADLYPDNLIDIMDILKIAIVFGETYP